MDIHLSDVRPTDEEREAIDSVLGPPVSRWHGGARTNAVEEHVATDGRDAREHRDRLLPALHALNDRVGWISEGGLNYICERLTIPPAEAYGVASFYHMFSLKPRPKTVVYVCDDIACMCAGSEELIANLEREVAREGETYGDGRAVWVRSPCLGLCDNAPAAIVAAGGKSEEYAPAALADVRGAASGNEPSNILGNDVDAADRRSALQSTKNAGESAFFDGDLALEALRRAFELGPSGVIAEITESKLMGRGGAAFPTGRKWEAVAKEPERPHYIVCNADESEPGTFKDRVLMCAEPYDVIVGMTIGALAGGCEKGFIYIRGEYWLSAYALDEAIGELRARGYLGKNILGSGFDFDIEIRRGAGAYICGEETALFNSIEGYRGEPRNKPPFPVQKGLFGKPTIVNNVETLENIPTIIAIGGKAFAQVGTPESTGPKYFCLSGHVEKPGLYAVPFGTTLRSLIEKAGGVRGGKKLQAVLLGGAAGTFLTPDELDVPLSFEGVRAIKASLGSGVVMAFDETVDLRKIVARIAHFFREESCGQCVPCRVGTARQEELLQRLAGGKTNGNTAGEHRLLAEIGQAMRDASICGLGQTASSAIESALAKFDLFGART